MKAIRSKARRYLLTLAIVAVAIALRWLLDPVMGVQGVAIFLVAIMVGAWIGGIGPAVMCVVLLHLAHGYGFNDPRRLWEPNLASVISTLAYYGIAITVGALSQMRATAQRLARDQQLEAVSQHEQLHITLACIADGVMVTDVHGCTTLINPAAERMTGWNAAESSGRQWREVMAIQREAGQDDPVLPIDRVLLDGRVVQGSAPVMLTARSGQNVPIAYSAAPLQDVDGHITGMVLVFRDESERLRTELALRNADQRKDEFLATLAHELRNPLAPISTGLELLGMATGDPAAAEDVRLMMQRQTQHMVRLIDDLMDVSRITGGRLELRRSHVELADIVRNAVEATRPAMDQAGHQFHAKLPERRLPLYVDANRMTQVITNLLHNAAKYTPPKGRIELTAEHLGDEVAIAISDTGIGIPAEKIDSVFEMFTQIHEGGDHVRTGLGIGLTLVKRLVEMHGGSVEVQSGGRNLGTTFRVRLPAPPKLPAEVARVSQERIESPPIDMRRVLVVDDNVDILNSLGRLVATMGHDVRRAQDGLEAIEIGRAFQPHIVLMDLGMPKLNGLEAARRMRQEPWGKGLALVATSGWGQDSDRQRSAEAGFDRHLVKPITIVALREVLEAPVLSPVAR